MIYSSTLLLSLFVTMPLILVFIRIARRFGAMDIPGERKIHSHPIPRIGGIALVIGTFASTLLWATPSPFFKAYAAGVAIIVFFGLIDDLKDLSYIVKLVGQCAASFVIVFYGEVKIDNLGAILPEGYLLPAWIAVPFTVIVIVGITNAINLADGLDGLAGGISLLSFCCIGYLAYIQDNAVISLLSLSLIGSIFGFLRFNTYPATLFMGDTGSQFLGFSLAAMSLELTQRDTALSPVLPLIILGFPILDTLTVMVERIADGRSPFAADKNHFHHRLMRLGFFHTEAVFIIYLIYAFCVISAFLMRYYSEWILLSGYLIFAGLILGFFHLLDKKGWKFKRIDFIDRIIKGRLKILKENGLLIIVPFKCIEIGLPLLLFAASCMPMNIPQYFSFICVGFMALIGITWVFKRRWIRGVLTFSLYFFVSFVMYLMNTDDGLKTARHFFKFYNLFILLLVLFVVMTLRFTKRTKGFKVTTMDFLILLIALVAPYVAGAYIQHKELSAVAASSIALFFSYEVLMGELRGEYGRLTIATVVTLGVVVVRGMF
ncbi:MAG: undecaprenyl/decaprenyl-phosphate alpha-N-acetylglucosaminyl 1-phosphate transferase [Syntrophus sp. (in: bacteria)]|nr:undecaprenyl/decaprenyl-phosphate alpha-N-acetylglucosaminyl 1-phosphate transferase [Syntrophus sp. (in: bacteria)]